MQCCLYVFPGEKLDMFIGQHTPCIKQVKRSQKWVCSFWRSFVNGLVLSFFSNPTEIVVNDCVFLVHCECDVFYLCSFFFHALLANLK